MRKLLKLVTERLEGDERVTKCLLSEDATHGKHGGATVLNLVLTVILLGAEFERVEVELTRLSTRAHSGIVDGRTT